MKKKIMGWKIIITILCGISLIMSKGDYMEALAGLLLAFAVIGLLILFITAIVWIVD